MANNAANKAEDIQPAPIDKTVSWDINENLVCKVDLSLNIEYANQEFIDVAGYDEFELIGKPFAIFKHPEMPVIVLKLIEEDLKKAKPTRAIMKNLSKSGKYFWTVTQFEITKNQAGMPTNYFIRQKGVDKKVVEKISTLYDKLKQIERSASVDVCRKYLEGFLEDKGVDYQEYLQSIASLSPVNPVKATPPRQPAKNEGGKKHDDHLTWKEFTNPNTKGFWDF